MIKYYIDENGVYLGMFVDGAVPAGNFVEVPACPSQNHIWEGGAWVYSAEKHWSNIRSDRDFFLAETDILAAATDHPQHNEILAYRQALRDIPETYATPQEVVWPQNPLED